MLYRKTIFWLVFVIYWCNGCCVDVEPIQNVVNENKYRLNREKSTYSMLSESISQAVNNENLHESCSNDDFTCLSSTSNDKLGLEAITALHTQLDDDANGNVDLSETGDFLREDLKLDSGYENRQKAFHFNDDMHISVKELWEAWLRSEVHNWTIEQTTEWLITSVDLPQYVDNFIKHRVTGANLPRLAVNNMHYLSILGIKDPIHKQKISLKAMDAVLFGPPKESRHHWKDFTLIVLIIGGGIGLWYAIQQNKKFKNHLNRMSQDMDGLQNAEKALENLQKELEVAKLAQENVVSEKENLEKRLQESAADSINGLHNSFSDLEVSQLKQEIEMLRRELQAAEGELKDRCWSAPLGLQQWLQLTHEIENKAYVKKKVSAEKQLQHARDACEKLRKKRSSLVGAFVSTHGKSIDEVDRSIVEARTSLNEVTQELQERVHRWKQIEMLCSFNIINNNGLQSLENILYRNLNGRAFGLRGRMSSQDELDDDSNSVYAPSATGHLESMQSQHWKDNMDSSGSEASRQDDDGFGEPIREREQTRQNLNSVQFIVGGEITNSTEDAKFRIAQSNNRASSNNNTIIKTKAASVAGGAMTRSYSNDTNIAADMLSMKQMSSHSDTALNQNNSKQCQTKPARPKTIREQAPIALCIEEDICSTDSSVVDDEVKKKKRKLFGFGKKSKAKGK